MIILISNTQGWWQFKKRARGKPATSSMWPVSEWIGTVAKSPSNWAPGAAERVSCRPEVCSSGTGLHVRNNIVNYDWENCSVTRESMYCTITDTSKRFCIWTEHNQCVKHGQHHNNTVIPFLLKMISRKEKWSASLLSMKTYT